MYHSFFPWLFIFLLGMLALIPWLYRSGNKRRARLALVRSRGF